MYDNEYPNGTGTPGQEEESDRLGKYYPIYDAANDYNNYGGTPSGSNDHDRKPRKEKAGFGKKLAAAVVLGLFFGICAGIGFFSIGFAAGNAGKEEAVAVSEEQALTDDTADTETSIESMETEESMEAAPQAQAPEISQSRPVLSESGSVSAVVTDVTGIVEQVMPAMVSILNNYTERTSYFGQTYTQQEQASGSGIIIGENDT